MIYLDNNATTRVHPEVVEAMLPFYREFWGNPSSMHFFGAQVLPHLDQAREAVAALVGAARASEIIFTSGGTESNNLAIQGMLQKPTSQCHIVTTQVEHPSILAPCHKLEKEGAQITYLGVEPNGELRLSELQEALNKETTLVSIMWANNETGNVFPIEKIAKICAAKNVPLHVDAVQAVGKILMDVSKLPIQLLSLSGHKFYSPKGIGALYVRRGMKLNPQILGGGQERSLRAGTQNVAHIIGLGKAAQIAKNHLNQKDHETMASLRDNFERELVQKFPWLKINGKNMERVPNTSSLCFDGLDAETIALLLGEEGVATSTTSACCAGSLNPSHVLTAMGLNASQARGTLRISLSTETTEEELKQTLALLEKIIHRLKH